jgi:predicted glycoside hydrolase/deacetylase ChbG (UPF0249 family)
MTGRRLIVNADDFGLSAGINRGVVRAHVDGIVTSASLMVRPDTAAAAASAARQYPELGLGLHLDLCEWQIVEGDWRPRYQVVDTGDAGAVAREVEHQLARFRSLVGRDPTHLDSHQHVHREEPVRSVLVRLSRSLRVPLRHAGRVRFCGAFYGQGRAGVPLPDAVGPDHLVSIIRGLPQGFTELCCHPGEGLDVPPAYGAERRIELLSLCDERAADALREAGVRLCSFRDLATRAERIR